MKILPKIFFRGTYYEKESLINFSVFRYGAYSYTNDCICG